jgi:carbon-monoxide dehydrogenase medium subunit
MIPTPFEYQRASSLDDAIAKLSAGGSGAKLLAGGHSLVPLMKLRLSEPGTLVDIGRLKDLAGVREKDGAVQVGAATTHHDVATSPLLAERCPMLAEAAAEIGDPQVRNRGTVGGSLAHADPAADYPAVMLALDAEIHVKGPNGWRKIRAQDFFQNLFTVDLAPNEIIAGVQFTPVRSAAYAKLHQKASHFAIVGVAAALEVGGGTIRSARVGLTGASTHATRLTAVEQALTGKPATKDSCAAAAQNAGADLDVVNADIHAGEEYRRAMIDVFTRRALEKALSRTGELMTDD